MWKLYNKILIFIFSLLSLFTINDNFASFQMPNNNFNNVFDELIDLGEKFFNNAMQQSQEKKGQINEEEEKKKEENKKEEAEKRKKLEERKIVKEKKKKELDKKNDKIKKEEEFKENKEKLISGDRMYKIFNYFERDDNKYFFFRLLYLAFLPGIGGYKIWKKNIVNIIDIKFNIYTSNLPSFLKFARIGISTNFSNIVNLNIIGFNFLKFILDGVLGEIFYHRKDYKFMITSNNSIKFKIKHYFYFVFRSIELFTFDIKIFIYFSIRIDLSEIMIAGYKYFIREEESGAQITTIKSNNSQDKENNKQGGGDMSCHGVNHIDKKNNVDNSHSIAEFNNKFK